MLRRILAWAGPVAGLVIVAAWSLDRCDRSRPEPIAGTVPSAASTSPASALERRAGGFARTSSAAAPGSVSGKVTDADGESIRDVRVCASPPIPSLVRTSRCVVAPNGEFRIDDLAPAPYVILASAAGHVPGAYRGPRRVVLPGSPVEAVALGAGEHLHDLDIVLTAGASTVAGRVLDAGGGPVAGALVSWLRIGTTYDPQARVTTGDDGAFALGVRGGLAVLEASADGYVTRVVQVAAPAQSADIVLAPGASLHGLVMDEASGAAVPGIRITLEGDLAGGGFGAGLAIQETDREGRFEFTGIPPGAYRIIARGPGWIGLDLSATVTAERPEEVLVTVRRAAMVAGRVVERQRGEPCQEGAVRLRLVAEEEPRGRPGETPGPADAPIAWDGSFWFEAVVPGRYLVEAVCEGFARSSPPPLIAVGSRDLLGLRLEVEAGLTLRGVVVRHDGVPAPGVAVEAALDDAPRVGLARSRVDGTFEIKGLDPGRYLVAAVSHERDDLSPRVAARLAGGGAADLRLVLQPTGGVRVRLRDRDGQSVTDGRVLLVSEETGYREAEWNGEWFRAENLPPGNYALRALGPRGEPLLEESAKATVHIDRETTVELTVRPLAATLEGRVLAPDGSPILDAIVTARTEDESGETVASDLLAAVTDSDGSFRLGGLGDVPYRLVVSTTDRRRTERRGLRPGGSAIVVTLPD